MDARNLLLSDKPFYAFCYRYLYNVGVYTLFFLTFSKFLKNHKNVGNRLIRKKLYSDKFIIQRQIKEQSQK